MRSVPVFRIGVLACVSALAMLSGACKKKGNSAALDRENMVASETPGGDFIHPNYRFTVSGLDNRWKILSREEAEGILPDAAFVAMRVGGVYGAVIVEPLGDVDPADYLELLTSNMKGSLIKAEVSEVEEVVHHGEDARAVEIDGELNGAEIHYRILAFIHRGFGYQVLTWSLKDSSGSERAGEFLEAVRVLEGEITAPPVVAREDSSGIGRRIHDGRFESPVYRVAARPTDGWKLMGEQELRNNTEGAEIGLKNDGIGAYITITPEFAVESRRELFTKAFEAGVAGGDEGGVVPEILEPLNFDVAGRSIEFMQTVVDAVLPLRMYQAQHFEGAISYKIAAWHFEQREGDFSAEIRAGFGGVEFLDEKEADEIAAALQKEPDLQSAVGPDFSLRGGVFRDFESGTVWRKPAGFWRIDTGDAARMTNSVISMQAEEVSHGLTLQLISEELEDWDDDEFHEAVLQNFASTGEFDEPVSFPPIMVDGKPAMVSKVRQTIQGMPMERFVVTTVRGDFAHQIQLWAWEDGVEGTPEMIGLCVAGFSFPGDALKRVEKSSNSYIDQRVGFGLDIPGTGWRIRDNLHPNFAPFGNSVQFTRGKESVMVMGLAAPDGRESEKTIRQLVEGFLKVNYERASNSGSNESSMSMGGGQARVLSLEMENQHMRVVTLARGGNIYLVMIQAESGAKAGDLLNEVRARFKILP